MEKILRDYIKDVIGQEEFDYMTGLEEIYYQIGYKVSKCAHCEGHYFVERDDREYSSNYWWLCDNEFDNHLPTEYRKHLLEEFCTDEEDYWLYRVFYNIEQFENIYDDSQGKFIHQRDFDVELFNEELPPNVPTWQEMVKEDVRNHIKYLTEKIAKAYNVRLLKPLFNKLMKEGKVEIKLVFEPDFDAQLWVLGHLIPKYSRSKYESKNN